MLHYLIQTVVFQLMFLLVYDLLLKKETFFSYNRLYLLLTPLLSLIIPFLNLEFLRPEIGTSSLIFNLPEVLVGDSERLTSGNSEYISSNGPGSGGVSWLYIIYGAGIVLSLLIFTYKFRNLLKIWGSSAMRTEGVAKIVEVPDSRIACTFFNTVFLGSALSERERDQILSHELIHVQERHTLDLIYFELFKIIFWFNPLVYIFQSRISVLHEFIADAGVVKSVEKKVYYQQLLNTAFGTQNISFINLFFNHSIIKKRIVMLQKSKSNNRAKFKFFIILPLMLAMLTYVACSDESGIPQDDQETSVKEQIEEITLSASDSEISSQDKKRIMDILDGTGSMQSVRSTPKKGNIDETKTVPFAVLEEVPVFPGCEEFSSNSDRKKCFADQIVQHVNQSFDTSLGKENGLSGVNRTYVQFKINKEGRVEVMGVRGPHPALEKEATRVINLLPTMVPGKHGGETVNVLYSLPITFQAGA